MHRDRLPSTGKPGSCAGDRPMRKLPPLAAVRVFEAAGRHENFTAAASELGMTQAAVSYQVKALEDRLGAPLFVRERGRAKLTALGGRLMPQLKDGFDTIEGRSRRSRRMTRRC